MPFFPASYANPYIPQMYQNQYIPQQQTQQNGFLAAWIQGGEQSMKSYTLTGANQRVYLFSTDENIFGVKSTDASGMPLPLEMFRYERISAEKLSEKPTEPQIKAVCVPHGLRAVVCGKRIDSDLHALLRQL